MDPIRTPGGQWCFARGHSGAVPGPGPQGQALGQDAQRSKACVPVQRDLMPCGTARRPAGRRLVGVCEHRHTCAHMLWLLVGLGLHVCCASPAWLRFVLHSSACTRLCCDGEPALNRPAQTGAQWPQHKGPGSAPASADPPAPPIPGHPRLVRTAAKSAMPQKWHEYASFICPSTHCTVDRWRRTLCQQASPPNRPNQPTFTPASASSRCLPAHLVLVRAAGGKQVGLRREGHGGDAVAEGALLPHSGFCKSHGSSMQRTW